MTLRIAQDSRFIRDGLWEWSVWIEGDQLDEVHDVAWHLHPTFPEPLRWRSDRSDGFKLVGRGWGEFEIKATMYNERGQPSSVSAWLELGGSDRPAPSKGRVYISASLHDNAIAHRLRDAFRDEGIDAQDAQTSLSGEDWDTGIETSISRAQVVLPVIKGQLSPIVEQEIEMARATDTPVVPIVIGDAELPRAIADIQSVRVADESNLDDAVARAFDFF